MAKITKVSGKLGELGQFVQQAKEMRYSSIGLNQHDGSVTKVPRVIVPNALNKMLEMGAPVSLYLARKGPWNFCYAVETQDDLGESYDGYRLFYVFNRSMMFINLMGGIYLLAAPGLRVAGAGLLSFGILFAWLGPPTIRNMRTYLQKHRERSSEAENPSAQAEDH